METVGLLMLVLVAVIGQVKSHGMVVDPPNRATAWRFGFTTPVDYNDNQLYCGGRDVQIRNGGKCGECGDNWADRRPRMHETGGLYGTGKIVEKYKAGSDIVVKVNITANHRGMFRFALCPLDRGQVETEQCFEQHPVLTSQGSAKYKLPSFEPGMFNVKLKLPKGLVCEHCVLQWTYETANSWGVCEDGHGALGCGPQEHFRTCSDIALQ